MCVLECILCVYDQVPAFETADGKPITESNAIAYYGECHETMAVVKGL